MIERIVTRVQHQSIADCTTVLQRQGLQWEDDIEGSVIIYNSIDGSYSDPVATASYSAQVIKCVAVDPLFEGTGLAQRMITLLIEELTELGRDRLFLFTRVKNLRTFSELGFHPVAIVGDLIALLEQDPRGISSYCRSLVAEQATSTSPGPAAALVMNCNPFTLGHRSIIETAAAMSSILYIFVVTEDDSIFRTEDRLELVKQGTADLANVKVLEGGQYIISRNTFPTYFLKDQQIVDHAYALLDATIFAEHIAPALGITRRYVGDEPFCPVTDDYNSCLQEILPAAGIELTVIQRLEHEGRAISASEVRRLFGADDLAALKELVPQSTYEFLSSDASAYAQKEIRRRSSAGTGSIQDENR